MKVKRIKFAGISVIESMFIFFALIGLVGAVMIPNTVCVIINSILIGFYIRELLGRIIVVIEKPNNNQEEQQNQNQ